MKKSNENWCFAGNCHDSSYTDLKCSGDPHNEDDDCMMSDCAWPDSRCGMLPDGKMGLTNPWYPLQQPGQCQLTQNHTNIIRYLEMGARGCIPRECDSGNGSNTLFRDSDVPFYFPHETTTPNAGSFCRANTGVLSRTKSNYIGPSVGDNDPLRLTGVPLSLSDQCAMVHDIALTTKTNSSTRDDQALFNNLNWVMSVHGESPSNTNRSSIAMTAALTANFNIFGVDDGLYDYPFLSGAQDILNAIDSQQKNPSYTDEFIKLVDYKAPPDLTGVETRVVVDFGDLNEYRNPYTGKFQLTAFYRGP